MTALKLATFNINGVRTRMPVLLQWLEKERPDIVCLQELKVTDDKFPAAELQAAGYGALWHGQPSWNGVAILARDAEPLECRRGLPGEQAHKLAALRRRHLTPLQERRVGRVDRGGDIGRRGGADLAQETAVHGRPGHPALATRNGGAAGHQRGLGSGSQVVSRHGRRFCRKGTPCSVVGAT